MMQNTLLSIWGDCRSTFLALDAEDWARPAFFLLWLLILALPLRGMDRRDRVAGMVYSLFLTAAGVTLVIALPKSGAHQKTSLCAQLFLMLAMVGLSIWRWTPPTQAVAMAKDVKTQNPKLDH